MYICACCVQKMSRGKKAIISILAQRGSQDEEERRAERNRAVFEAWLEKKREERKVGYLKMPCYI